MPQSKNKRRNGKLVNKPNRKSLNPSQEEPMSWDEIEALRVACQQQIATTTQVRLLIGNKDKLATVKDITSLTNQTKVFLSDLKLMEESLEKIYDEHKNKSGMVSHEDHMHWLVVGQGYHDWLCKYTSVILPEVKAITDHFNTATVEEQPND
ncbi:hypothetical protein [Endozoicomonas sp. ONNA1]|uniref:hypothetical protein n=1 Tax=Endozoicomonas sp. ONNA1 TaxID=2828740 RepID=UPI002148CC69|nr:hypothetical protein [Endozoicomonas sp. ONNA1]